ncbi:MAG: hypothetical protein Q8R82_18450 [Hyphomonadaceae bacterium]|nr:hypothetical protein [Hyphomonadaceae bacterium]
MRLGVCVIAVAAAIICSGGDNARAAQSKGAVPSLDSLAIQNGRCTRLVLAGRDMTRGCNAQVLNEVYSNGRVTFTFTVSNSTTVTFSGAAPQVKLSGDVIVQPLDRFVWRLDAGVPSITKPVAGTCRYTNPYRGQATISCEAKGSEGIYRASFVSNGSPPMIRDF